MKLEIGQLERRIQAGLIRKQTKGDLSIYSYTEKCTFEMAWDKYTERSRGLILDFTGKVVALPFSKFWNVGEKCCPALPKRASFKAYSKIDGSLGIIFHHGGRWRVATRGSFDNDYTRWAEANMPDLSNFPTYWTVMAEICMPSDLDGMPRAVKHEPGLYYLGATDLYQINGVNDGDVCPSTSAHLWKGPIAESLLGAWSIDQLVRNAKHSAGIEGWVIRFDNGLRVKIKTAWYLQLFRAVSCLNEKHLKELMEKVGINECLQSFPEELREEAEALATEIRDRFEARREQIMKAFVENYHADRKTFALRILNHPERSYLFLIYDGKSIDSKLLEAC